MKINTLVPTLFEESVGPTISPVRPTRPQVIVHDDRFAPDRRIAPSLNRLGRPLPATTRTAHRRHRPRGNNRPRLSYIVPSHCSGTCLFTPHERPHTAASGKSRDRAAFKPHTALITSHSSIALLLLSFFRPQPLHQ
jgi:hypothetical protein